MEKIRAEVDKVTNEIDAGKIEKELKESLASVDWEKMNKQMEEMKKIDMSKLDADMKKMEIEMKGLGPKIEKEMENAKASIEKAKVEMKEYKSFVDGLEKDGLINKKEGYTIQHKMVS
jgi:ABC-type phosphate transport system auxiliary subunit